MRDCSSGYSFRLTRDLKHVVCCLHFVSVLNVITFVVFLEVSFDWPTFLISTKKGKFVNSCVCMSLYAPTKRGVMHAFGTKNTGLRAMHATILCFIILPHIELLKHGTKPDL
jgi:hypothetical protein